MKIFYEEPYDPFPEIFDQFLWACRNIEKFKGTPDEEKFRQRAQHLLSELQKYGED